MKKTWATLAGVMICGFLLSHGPKEPVYSAGPRASFVVGETSPQKNSISPTVDLAFGKMPLYFIRNEGQVDSRVGYCVQGKDKTIYFTSEGLTYVLSERAAEGDGDKKAAAMDRRRSINPPEREDRSPEARSRWVVKLDFVGANRDVRPSGEEKTEGIVSYFKGRPEEWKTGLPTYSKVVYRELWPGIDLVYYGTTGRLKYEFIVHPGADPSKILLACRGATAVGVDEAGRLEVDTPAGGFKDDAPVAWQDVDGRRVDVTISYELGGYVAAGTSEAKNIKASIDASSDQEADTAVQVYGFHVGDYDKTQTLVLDPAVLVYCGYIGGSSWDYGEKIAVDGSGNAYVTGITFSTEATFPVTVGADLTHNGSSDAFVAKVKADGTGLVYCSYMGGSDLDHGRGIAVDGSGNAYVTGSTESSEASFPVTVGPDLTYNGGYDDAFVAKVNSAGTGLIYCGYIGGSNYYDWGHCIAVDGSGNAYISGFTDATQSSFPVTVGPDLTHNGEEDAFVAKVSAAGARLVYCGYVGGSREDGGNGIAVDGSGNAYVTGTTSSTEASFPVTAGPDLTYDGYDDAFVAKVRPDGTGLVYCGYIGGSIGDSGEGIAVDGSGNAYITGETLSTEASFPVTAGPDLSYNGYDDAFVAKVNSAGTDLIYCGYIGGSDTDRGYEIAVDSAGYAYVIGETSSMEASFPVTAGPDLSYNGDIWDAFVAKVNSAGTDLIYCGYIGGSDSDRGYGIAVDGSGNAYVTGETYSTEASFPVKVGPDLTFNGPDYYGDDAFVAKISSTAITKEDILGTWDSTGVWYRNTETGAWVNLSSPANLVSAGDIDGDGTDDLVGVWGSGLWVRYTKTKSWAKLSANLPTSIACGDMSGDSRDDVVGSFASEVWYRNSATGTWVSISSSPASIIAAGYIDGDNKEDLIGVWNDGLWVKKSSSGTWIKISANLPTDIASGDINGDARDDVVGSWASGVWYRNSKTGGWVLMSSSAASKVAAGEIDGDGKDDLIGVWTSGFWVKKSATGSWMKITCSTLPRDIDAGVFRTGETADVVGFAEPVLISSEGPGIKGGFEDLSNEGPGSWRFRFEQEENLVPFESNPKAVLGPGDPGLQFEVQANPVPMEGLEKEQEKGKKATKK